MNIFGNKKQPVIGLDISSTAIKLIQLSKNGPGYGVEHFAIEPLPDGAVLEKSIANVDAVSKAIQQAVKRSGSRSKQCAVAVSGSSVITKTIALPADLSENELEGQIEVEANQYIPYSLDEVSLDFEVLGPSARNAATVDILLAASKIENIEMRRAAVEGAGLDPKVVDVEAFAIANAFELVRTREGLSNAQTLGVVEIGAHLTSLIVMRGDRVLYTREHQFGGHQLIQDVMRRYEMSQEQAMFFQRDEATPEGFEQDILEPFQQSIVQQISRALQFYSSSSDYTNVDSLYLAGGCARIDGLENLVSSELGINAAIADPIKGLNVSASVARQSLQRNAPALMVASGLAMRGFD